LLGALIAHHSVACIFQEAEAAQDCVISLKYHAALYTFAPVPERALVCIVVGLLFEFHVSVVLLAVFLRLCPAIPLQVFWIPFTVDG